jgi:hypothetical protein
VGCTSAPAPTEKKVIKLGMSVALSGAMAKEGNYCRLYADLWGKISHCRTPREPADGSCQSFDSRRLG